MKNHNSYEYGRREYQRSREDESVIVLVAGGAGLISVAGYVLLEGFHLRPIQLIEAFLYLASVSIAIIVIFWREESRGGVVSAWPQSPVFVAMLEDQKYVEAAAKRQAIVAGYGPDGRPWLWSDHQRCMQSILIGQSGSGKTTLLLNIASQDIHRQAGNAHLPLIIFDGKGDREFLEATLHEVAAAGRLDQFRLIDPFRPEISARFNPLFTRGSSQQEQVNCFFDSFLLRQDFFRAHQATYLSDVCRVLHFTGAIFNISDVVVMARDELVMKEQIAKARRMVDDDSSLSAQRRQNFDMSVRNLLQSLEDRERVPKIQGLLNELMSFAEDDISLITSAYDDLLLLDDVIERKLILFVSLNTNKNSRAVTALGRMLLQSLQLMIGERYLRGRDHGGTSAPMVSVILDEFAPFAHPNFAQMLQTARGSNVALLFSVQSIPQLRIVNRNFADEISSAPNTVMLLRTRDEETARFFLNASAKITGERRTMTVEKKGIFRERYEEIGFGSITETEKTRAVDYQIKNLPTGQMQVLTTDPIAGTLHLHLHVRRPRDDRLDSFAPVLFPRHAEPLAHVPGARLRFRNPDLARRMGRIFARTKRTW